MGADARHRRVAGGNSVLPGILSAVVFLLLGLPLFAQSDNPALPPAIPSGVPIDTTSQRESDSLRALAALDTIPSFELFAPPFGSVRVGRDAQGGDLVKEDLPSAQYYSLHELLRKKLPAFPLSLGAPGLLQSFSYAGSDPRAMSVSFGGRPLTGVQGSPYDPGFYSPDFLERAELLRGAEAAVYGDARSLLGLNLLQPRFNVAGSYLRLVFGHGGGNTTNADMTFSRNVAPRTNLTVGVRRVSAEGSYSNQDVSFWGVRGALTWRPTDGLTFSLSEMFSDLHRGLNGGLTAASSFNSFLDAVNDTLDEEGLRHDLTLAAQWYPSLPDGRAITDSTDLTRLLRFDGAIYYTHADRSLRVGDHPAELPGVAVRKRDDVVGLRGGTLIPLGSLVLHGNLTTEVTDGKGGRLHFGGMAELPAGKVLRLFGGAAVTRDDTLTTTTFFGEGRVLIVDSLELRLTGRAFADNGTSAPSASGTFSTERSKFLFEAEGRWSGGESYVTAGGYARSVTSTGMGGADYTILGGNVSFRLPVLFMVFEEELLLTLAPSGDKRFPLLQSRSDLSVPLSLFNDNLDLRLGASLEYRTKFAAAEYDYLTERWLYPADPGREKQLYPLLDAYARARIGSAYLKLTMSNILGTEYYSVYRYPTWGRTLQFGITWALID